jgi:hypothetical protein
MTRVLIGDEKQWKMIKVVQRASLPVVGTVRDWLHSQCNHRNSNVATLFGSWGFLSV